MKENKGIKKPLELRVLDFIREHRLVPVDSCLLVAVSGGPDSVCLLHILIRLKNELGIRLHLAHLNHQLRGTESEADARYVDEMARQFGIPATVARGDVARHQAEKRISLEEAAREVRYAFLAETARSVGADRVAVGHTSDDNVETILMHLVRGTGTTGLQGLKPYLKWRIAGGDLAVIRPLLTVSRGETTGYCQEHELKPKIDTSNFSLSPLRNKLRHQLLPLLKSYNPGIEQAILRTARIAASEIAFLEEEGERLWEEIARSQEDTIILGKESFIKLPPALKRHLLRMAFERLLGNLKDIETRHIEEIMETLNKPAGTRLSLPGNLTFSIEYQNYLIGEASSALSPFPRLDGTWTLNLPGKTVLPGWHINAEVINRPQPAMKKMDKPFSACLDLDRTGNSLTVRSRQIGDRFQPLGMSQLKKLGRFMIDARIPAAWRDRVPLVCSHEQILWVVGWRIDDRVKVTDKTERILRLEFERS
ncbi:MAG: tRNA lysidine(34) synthetase TilS [Dehalococcoidales bacterium]|nr:tRNA lysidine(34) synthetase TilS [Dehalococcoidales bacterium]